MSTLTATPGSTSVTLSWCCATTPARTFTIRRDDGTGTPTPSTGTLVYEGDALGVVDQGLELWKQYRYVLWAADGAGGYLAPKMIVTSTRLPVVTGLQASAASATSAKVTWDAPTDPSVAAVVITRTDARNVARDIYTGTAAEVTDTGLVPGMAYTYTAHPKDASGRYGQISGFVRLTAQRTWVTSTVSPFVGWPGALACATATWCMQVNNDGTYQVMSGTSWSKPVAAFAGTGHPGIALSVVTSLTCPAAGRCSAIRSGRIVEFDHGWRSTGSPSSGWTSVDCPTTTYCLAIRVDGWSTTRVGTSWTTPARIGTLKGVSWSDVACQAAARCFAVAGGNATSSNWRGTLTGSGWSTAYLGGSQQGHLARISCSATTCLGLGHRTRVTVSGTTWSISAQPSLDPSEDYTNDLSCGAPSLCVALNYGNVSRWSSTGLLERTRLSAGIGEIAGVSCPRTGGVCFVADDRGRLYRWTSTTRWVQVATTVQTTGGTGRIGCRDAASCFFVDLNGWMVAWNGSAWTRSAKYFTHPAMVECAGSGFCIAVDPTGRVHRVWSNGSWGASRTMPLAPVDLSCSGPTLCLAVDVDGRASRFDGAGWSTPVAALADPYAGGPRVSCAAGGSCMLVSSQGTYRRYVGASLTATQRFPSAVAAQNRLVSCGAPSSCISVTYDGSWAQWDGATWTPHPADAGSGWFGSLTCLTASHCVATHQFSNDWQVTVWNSGQWAFGGTYAPNEVPSAAECPTMEACFVAGGTTVSRSS